MQEKLLAYRLLVSEQMLAQGLSNVGDSRRMERFFEKLLRGVHAHCLLLHTPPDPHFLLPPALTGCGFCLLPNNDATFLPTKVILRHAS